MTEKFVVPALIDKIDSVELSDGSLFRLAPDLNGVTKIKSYLSVSRIGWHRIDHGYWMYIHKSEELGLIRFLGLSPNDTKPTKKLGISHPFSKHDFERYVENVVEDERRVRGRVQDELALLIHDLRRFSNSIYQNAAATKRAIYEKNGDEAAVRIENTLAAQAMLSIRTDILDLAESKGAQLHEDKIPVYRKFDKVVKSFVPGCKLKEILISISGSSHSLVQGPDCMEIIAYILADNALKYSPSNSSISVNVTEDDENILVSVSSLGPIISIEELDAIFEKGVRSKAASSIEKNGTGYGLFLAESLVSRFGGTISVQQDDKDILTSKGNFRDTTFSLKFPIFEKLLEPVHKHIERVGPIGEIKLTEKNKQVKRKRPRKSVRKKRR